MTSVEDYYWHSPFTLIDTFLGALISSVVAFNILPQWEYNNLWQSTIKVLKF